MARPGKPTPMALQLDTFVSNLLCNQHCLLHSDILHFVDFTMQKLIAIDSTELLDSSKFAFFKGVNGAADAQGNVQATVTGGVAAGAYRICTIVSYSNHQGVVSILAEQIHHSLNMLMSNSYSFLLLLNVVRWMTASVSETFQCSNMYRSDGLAHTISLLRHHRWRWCRW